MVLLAVLGCVHFLAKQRGLSVPRKPRDPAIDAQAAAAARAAWEVPTDRYSVQFRARVPKQLAEEMAGQRSTERGDTWADGWRVRQSLPTLLAAIDQLCPLEKASYTVDASGVTVQWGDWTATASTTTEAALMLLAKILPD